MLLRAAALSLLLSTTATAQSLKAYFGPTLGISTPDFGHPEAEYYFGTSYEAFTARRSPIPSPIIGLNGGYTVGTHLALDAAFQYSYTGQSFSADVAPAGYRERLRVHKIAVPLTVGYAGTLGRMPIRIGVGGSFQYLLSARVAIQQSIISNGQIEVQKLRFNAFEQGFYYSYPRLQAHPRVSLSAAITPRFLLTAAYSHGIKRIFASGYFGLYSSTPRNSAIDLSITYLHLRRPAAGKGAVAPAPGE